MNETFWNLFSTDYRRNCLLWHHSAQNPVIPASSNTWRSCWTANPDVIKFKGQALLYYRGNGVEPGTDGQCHDRIGVSEITGVFSDIIEAKELNSGRYVVGVGAEGEFDEHHVLDPAAVVFHDIVWLYYSAIGDGPNSVGLARSSDGVTFEKVGVVYEGRAPDVVVKDDKVFMLYQKMGPGQNHEFFLTSSGDGVHFKDVVDTPVFVPSGQKDWEGRDITTGRLFSSDETYYLMYGANSSLVDQPDYFGIAKSPDLVHWERHSGNPIFGCGAKGQEDGGAIWFPALVESQNYFHLLYEGSRGNYSGDLSSQICMASIPK